MTFKIKDGVRIGTVDVYNNSAESLNVKVKDTNAGTGSVAIATASLGSTSYTQTLQAKTGTIALTSDIAAAGDGSLTVTVAEDGTTGNSVYITTGTGFSANDTANSTYDIHVGPALKNLADLMTTAGAGFIKRGATADTYTIDTNTYLTAESDTLQTVTGRGASSNVATISLTSNTASTNTTTGTLVVTGGVGVGGALNVGGRTTVGGNLVVAGDLTVNGTTTTVNSSTLSVDDKNLELGAVVSATISTTGTVGSITGTGPWTATITGMTTTAGLVVGSAITATAGTGTLYGGTPTSCVVTSIVSGTSITYTVTGGTTPTAGTVTNIATTGATNVTADGGGITLKGTTDKTFNWVNATSAWTSSEHISLASGKSYYINGTEVLSSSTLGSGVTSSSLTKVGLTSAGYVKTNASGNLSASSTVTAGDLTGTIPSAVLGNSSLYIGTTSIALNRASAAQALTGITSIDGSAATLTTTRTLWGQNFNGSANVSGNLTSVGNITATAAITISSTTTSAITVDSGTTGAVNIGTNANAKAISIGNSTVSSTIALNNNTTLPAGKTLTLSGATSGTIALQAIAAAGTNTITFPAATGTVALTADIKDGQLTRTTPSVGATNTAVDLSFSATYSANTATNTTIKAVVGPALTGLANIMTGATPVGFLKKTGQDTYSIDTTTYLSSQSTDFKTVTVSDTDSGYTWADNGDVVAETVGDTLTIVSGPGVELDVDAAKDALRIRSQGSAYAYSDAITLTNAAPVANTAFNLDSWTKASYRAIKYVIGVTQGTTLYQTSEIMVFNDGTTSGQMTEYAVFSNDPAKEVTYTVDFSGTTAYLKVATPTASSITFNIHRTFIAA